MSRFLCITDSDFLIAQVMKSDLHHQKAVKMIQLLEDEQATILYPSTSILEAATTICRKYNNSILAQAVLDIFKNKDLEVIPVGREAIDQTTDIFNPKASKQNTPFDCVVVALARLHKAQIILGFDKFFLNKGFKTPKDF